MSVIKLHVKCMLQNSDSKYHLKDLMIEKHGKYSPKWWLHLDDVTICYYILVVWSWEINVTTLYLSVSSVTNRGNDTS